MTASARPARSSVSPKKKSGATVKPPAAAKARSAQAVAGTGDVRGPDPSAPPASGSSGAVPRPPLRERLKAMGVEEKCREVAATFPPVDADEIAMLTAMGFPFRRRKRGAA